MRFLLLLLLAACPLVSVQAEQARPNFVFIITDDISPDDLSVYGNAFVKTPNLEKIAQAGLVFENAYNTISSCSPSRCSIITGRYPHNTGAPELHTKLPSTQTTFVQLLKAAGYHTVISGKNHMASPEQLGFDVASTSKPAGSEKWVTHLRERPKEKPFFCWFASLDAHHAFDIDEHAPEYTPEEIVVPPMLYDGPETRKELTGYYHEVSRTDYYAGQVWEELQKQGIAENTYFIYCSDNGRPFLRCKTYLYDSGIKTPLIITGPNVKPGRSQSFVSSIDYSATILELAGVDKPETIQGQSIVSILKDPKATVREILFAERNWHVFQNHARMVRMGDWLYIWNAWPNRHNVSGESSVFSFPSVKEYWEAADAGKLNESQMLLVSPIQPEEMLFRISDDPHQLTNLATDTSYEYQMQKMRKQLKAWENETSDSVPENPTKDRQPLHSWDKKNKMVRGQFPGASAYAEVVNEPGPITLPKDE